MTTTLQKILYVEDDDLIAEIVVMTLEDLGGFEVVHASSGKEALSIFPVFQPQLILLDVMMPGMTGYDVCARLKASPATAAIPVIFVTALKDEVDETKGFAVGAVEISGLGSRCC